MAKRLFDIALSLSGLLVSGPLMLAAALMIKKGDGGPVFYRGLRAGLHGVPFRIYKFRTMVLDAEKIGASSTPDDDPRITRAGAFLRKYKLDELPQLLNVLAGDMSFVGPRPQVLSEVAFYTNEQKRLLDVKPGITDYASIKFRNEGEILRGSPDPDRDYREKIAPEKIRLGLEYVRNNSISGDISIIISTLRALVQ